MFINLSNHPSEMWGKEQLLAAEKYGKIVDLSFPIIEPAYTKEEVLHLVKEYTEEILKIKEDNTVVHVMGEMTFTHNIVNILKEANITCLASTTMRNVVITHDDKKISEFKFVQFREY